MQIVKLFNSSYIIHINSMFYFFGAIQKPLYFNLIICVFENYSIEKFKSFNYFNTVYKVYFFLKLYFVFEFVKVYFVIELNGFFFNFKLSDFLIEVLNFLSPCFFIFLYQKIQLKLSLF